MLADQDHPLETSAETDLNEPKVIVVYRSRGVPWLLIPPMLLLVVVGAIIVYRKTIPPAPPRPAPAVISDETLALSEQAAANLLITTAEPAKPVVVAPVPTNEVVTPPAAPPATISVPAPIVTPAPLPETIAVAPLVTPAPAPSVAPIPDSKPEPEEIAVPPADDEARREPVGFDPEAAKTAAAALSVPKPEEPQVAKSTAPVERGDSTPPMVDSPQKPPSDEMLEEMQREAEERLAARAGINPSPPAKPDLLNSNPRDVKGIRRELIMSTIKLAAQDRVPFHTELRQLLADQGNRAGPNIQQLCNRYGRDTLPEIHFALNRDLGNLASRLSIAGRIKRMRRWGVPETIVLDDLVETEIHDLKSRGGPRNEAQAWVRAAKILLANPPTTRPATAINAPDATDAPTPPPSLAAPGN